MSQKALIVQIDATQLHEMVQRLNAIGRKVGPVAARAINRTGDMATTQVKRALAPQMGLGVGKIGERMKISRADANSLSYAIRGFGRPIGMKDFASRQTRKGVSAQPWGDRKVFPHSFVVKSLHGHVFKRTGEKVRMGMKHGRKRDSAYAGELRQPIKVMYGPGVPKELVKDQSKRAFESTVASVLPRRIAYEMARLFGT